MALAHGSFCFAEPSRKPMPLAVRVAEPVGLLASRAFDDLFVQERVAYRGLAVHNFGERDGHAESVTRFLGGLSQWKRGLASSSLSLSVCFLNSLP